MKAIMIMFDSLNRRMLPPYGCDWVKAPNFERLAREAVTFDSCYAGSLPCMPARRELHTGRYNFLHRSWGPLEPFDDSMPELLKNHGIYTHLASDHYHYWEDGGCTYHTRYSSWEIARGQEGDPWKGHVADPQTPAQLVEKPARHRNALRQDWINRTYMTREEDQPQAVTFENGKRFIETNHGADGWFLHIETFDPHEPFFTQNQYQELYPHDYSGPHFDWPNYDRVREPGDAVEHCRLQYAALVSMCDRYLGRVLSLMDEYGLWSDTMLIVNTDHGFLLGEHGWWAKCVQPFYNEVAHLPLFLWDPRVGFRNRRCPHLVQTIDVAPTLLDFFGVEVPADMQGRPLRTAYQENRALREAALFGIHGGHVNCTDGRYVYMRAPANPGNEPLYEYTLMPTHMKAMFSPAELGTTRLQPPLSFSKGCPLLKVRSRETGSPHPFSDLLFDLKQDPGQENPIQDPELQARMTGRLTALMRANDAPPEQYERLGLDEGAP